MSFIIAHHCEYMCCIVIVTGVVINEITIVSGRGVFAVRKFDSHSLLLEYRGIMTFDEPSGPDTYIYEFVYQGKQTW